jgi:peroxiredoxin
MKKISIMLCAAMTMAVAAHADIKVNVPDSYNGKQFVAVTSTIDDIVAAKSRIIKSVEDSVVIAAPSFTLSAPTAPSRIFIYVDDARLGSIYAAPGENLVLTFAEDNSVVASGTPLMDQIEALSAPLNALEKEYAEVRMTGDEARMEAIIDEYNDTLKKYIEQNPDNEGSVFAVMNLDGQEFVDYAAKLGDKAKASIIYPLMQRNLKYVQEQLAEEARQRSMEENHVEAPDFTLPGLDGKDVSLSDFRGKWVILDFWGSWCGWCIKGMPRMKEAYEQYKDKLEIVGVDCNDSDEAWRAAVAKYKLPWVHVYNNQDSIYQAYGVQGFPTKVIIDPEGKIYKIVVGEDPKFYDILAELMAK